MAAYNDYAFVDFASGGVHKRNNIISIPELKNKISTVESYCTYFRYNEDMIRHMNEKGTVSGFNGRAYADWLPIDIDSKNLEEAQIKLGSLIGRTRHLGIKTNQLKIFFSGSKGFHVMIPSSLFDVQPSADIHLRFRKVADFISGDIDIDKSIYDKTRLLRLQNTQHKSGFYKIQLYPHEAVEGDINDIKQMAMSVRESIDVQTPTKTIQALKDVFKGNVSQSVKTSNDSHYRHCIKTILKGVDHDRDNHGMRLADHFLHNHVPRNQVMNIMDEWNSKNKPPKPGMVERVIRQVEKRGYNYGCNDTYLKRYCHKDCPLYKE